MMPPFFVISDATHPIRQTLAFRFLRKTQHGQEMLPEELVWRSPWPCSVTYAGDM